MQAINLFICSRLKKSESEAESLKKVQKELQKVLKDKEALSKGFKTVEADLRKVIKELLADGKQSGHTKKVRTERQAICCLLFDTRVFTGLSVGQENGRRHGERRSPIEVRRRVLGFDRIGRIGREIRGQV